jgi:hypothetical protein
MIEAEMWKEAVYEICNIEHICAQARCGRMFEAVDQLSIIKEHSHCSCDESIMIQVVDHSTSDGFARMETKCMGILS